MPYQLFGREGFGGRGRLGCRWWSYAPTTKEDEIFVLEQRAKAIEIRKKELDEELEYIKKRIDELKRQ